MAGGDCPIQGVFILGILGGNYLKTIYHSFSFRFFFYVLRFISISIMPLYLFVIPVFIPV